MAKWQFYENQHVEVDMSYRLGRLGPPEWRKAKIVNHRPMDTDYYEVKLPDGPHLVFDVMHIRAMDQ